ncbi:unnamed protein product [Paramecium pentaurelia]|uniref:RING-type domain-containing protein n=1 Tax=Paramecium pentaurelia TaxID=43138 RepID=A0A8S1VJQ4_9CILI|nr:unnamed protein product [Paramecium pentaurelia]
MISCPFCDEIMANEVYWIHIKFCEQQIGQYNLIQQPCHQCGQMIVKLYFNDHLEICEGNFWTQVKCPHCSEACFKSELKDHLNKCPTLLEQQNREKHGITQCTICFEDVFENKKQLICSHSFHQECIDNWFKQQKKCPICKTLQII